MHLLPAVEKSMVAIEQLLGDRAQGLVMELEDIKSSVWQKAERVRETSVRLVPTCRVPTSSSIVHTASLGSLVVCASAELTSAPLVPKGNESI